MKSNTPFVFILFKYLPFWLIYGISDFLYLVLRFVFPYRKKVIEKNLRNSFPHKSTQEIKILTNNYYRHLSDILVESLKMYGLSDDELLKRMQIKNPEVLEKLFLDGKSAIGVGAHYCNWEWGSLILPIICKQKTIGVYKPLSNKKWNNFFIQLRAQKGMSLIAMNNVVRELLMHKKEPTFTVLIADQSPMKAEIQYWAEFLNQKTPVYLGPEKLAKSMDFPVYYLQMEKIKRGFYVVELLLISNNPKSEVEYFISNSHLSLLEKQIINHPENWLWSHKRWKHLQNN